MDDKVVWVSSYQYCKSPIRSDNITQNARFCRLDYYSLWGACVNLSFVSVVLKHLNNSLSKLTEVFILLMEVNDFFRINHICSGLMQTV
jgi:hypothetical protein